jgi:hypothetical protein
MIDLPTFLPQFRSALDEFESYSKAALQARESATNIVSPLYHYTDAAGVKGIIERQQVWFTHYMHLNDPSELRFGMDIARSVLNEIAGDEPSPKRFFCKCVEDIYRPENFHSNIEFYLASFSRERDDLGQWRAYGANGRGYAIGLAPHLFAIEDKPDRRPHENVFVSPVVYGEGETIKLIRPAIERAVILVEQVADENPDLMEDRSIRKPFVREMTNQLIASALIPASLIAKHQAYAHENEVRLMILGPEATLRPYIETRTRASEIVPYIRSDMPIRNDGIVEIVAGPAAGDAGVTGLKTFLRLQGLDADSLVRSSTIPYRPA